MSHTKLLSTILFMACVLLVTVAVAAPVSNDQPVAGSGSAIRTSLQPNLTFKSTLSPELLPAAIPHHRTCRCSCGYPCDSDADCGPGGRCDAFISCCDRGEANLAFQQIAGRSTRTGEAPAVAVNLKCK
jgi:hypothetical protein